MGLSSWNYCYLIMISQGLIYALRHFPLGVEQQTFRYVIPHYCYWPMTVFIDQFVQAENKRSIGISATSFAGRER